MKVVLLFKIFMLSCFVLFSQISEDLGNNTGEIDATEIVHGLDVFDSNLGKGSRNNKMSKEDEDRGIIFPKRQDEKQIKSTRPNQHLRPEASTIPPVHSFNKKAKNERKRKESIDKKKNSSAPKRYTSGDHYLIKHNPPIEWNNEIVDNNSYNERSIIPYPNGDYWDGPLRNGLPDGDGMYVFANGDVFIGFMKNGRKYGPGQLIARKILRNNASVTLTYNGLWKYDYPNQYGTLVIETAYKGRIGKGTVKQKREYAGELFDYQKPWELNGIPEMLRINNTHFVGGELVKGKLNGLVTVHKRSKRSKPIAKYVYKNDIPVNLVFSKKTKYLKEEIKRMEELQKDGQKILQLLSFLQETKDPGKILTPALTVYKAYIDALPVEAAKLGLSKYGHTQLVNFLERQIFHGFETRAEEQFWKDFMRNTKPKRKLRPRN